MHAPDLGPPITPPDPVHLHVGTLVVIHVHVEASEVSLSGEVEINQYVLLAWVRRIMRAVS
jgi:hypothetical protein